MVEFVTGPLLYISLAVFVIGLTVRVVMYVNGLSQKLDRVAYKAHMGKGLKGACASIFRWMIPGATHGWRVQPFMMIVFFMFHIGAVLLPLFILGHTIVMEYYLSIGMPALPGVVSDVLSIIAVIGLAGLAARRIFVPEARFLTTAQDWFILVLTAVPFVTGVLARYTGGTEVYDALMFAHVLSGEIFLILAPFTKLSHMVLYFLSRAQIGMDFAIKRGGMNRKTEFPW